LVLCAAVVFFVPNAQAHFQLVAVLFFVGFFMAIYPWLRLNAPYSFGVFAMVLWFMLGIVFPILAVLLR
jgi:hypothetical protein